MTMCLTRRLCLVSFQNVLHMQVVKFLWKRILQLLVGTKDAVASEMTKWFNTNYHYIVPELEGVTPKLVENRPLAFYKEAKEKLGIDGKPVILGPVTYIKLAKSFGEENFAALLEQFTPLYIQVLKELAEAGAEWVQIDEPILTSELSEEEFAACSKSVCGNP